MQYLLILIAFLYGLVTPTTVYESCRAAGAFFFEKIRAFFEKARFGVPKPCLLRFSEPQALFFQKNDMPFLKKVCFGQKLTFLVNIGQYSYARRSVPDLLSAEFYAYSAYSPLLCRSVPWGISNRE